MIYALSGPHRCGKTFLAELLAEKHDLYFQPSVVGDCFRKVGLKPDQNLTWQERIHVQTVILDALCSALKQHRANNVDVICDRSSLDLIGYTVTTMVEQGDYDHASAVSYLDKCFEALSFFDKVLLIPSHPDLEFKAEDYKGRNEAQHIRLLESAILTSAMGKGYITMPRSIALADRLNYVETVFGLK